MNLRVMGIDPSSTEIGWAVLDGDEIYKSGTFITSASVYHKRFDLLIDDLEFIRTTCRVTHVASERAMRFAGRRVVALEYAVRCIEEWAKEKRFGLGIYSPGEWKASVVGNGGADKPEVQRIVRLRWNFKPATEHEADAICIAAHHAGVLVLKQGLKEQEAGYGKRS